MRHVPKPPLWLRVGAVSVPLLLLAASFSAAQRVETILIQALLVLALIGVVVPATTLTVVAALAVMSLDESAVLPVLAAAAVLAALWRVAAVVDRLLGVAFVVPIIAFRSEVVMPLWVWWLGVFPVLIVALNRKVLTDAVSRARHPGPVDLNPSRTLNPTTSEALERMAWPLVAEMDGAYLHASPFPGTYAVCAKKFVFLVTRFGARLLTTTNGAAGPSLPYELVQRVPSSRPDIDVLVARHREALEFVTPHAGPPSRLEDLVDAFQDDQAREAAVIEAESWKLAAGMAWSLLSRPDRVLADGPRSLRRIGEWLEHPPTR